VAATIHQLDVADQGPVEITVDECGKGRPFLLLHGGAGPGSLVAFAQLFAEAHPARVFTPTHPGFSGTARPNWLVGAALLAEIYTQLLDELDLREVTVVGTSLGGWITAEMALRGSDRVGAVILIDAIGITVADHPVANVQSLTTDELNRRIFHDPSKLRTTLLGTDPAAAAYTRTVTPAAGEDRQTSPALPPLLECLHQIKQPTLVLWGESDQIVDSTYGRAYAAAIPGAEFQLLTETGHNAFIESPEKLLQPLWDFAEGTPSSA